ncbi:MAG: bifunctional UDP-N-acetylglucosamine diphosphorylase/glucosamine-1-phosphate N-acetyltransferase GlmU [Alphaproteobacteria bacterium]
MTPPDHSPLSIVVLAAGKGKRMRSSRPKVLHEVARRPLLHHVLATAAELGARETIVVVGPGMEEVGAAARAFAPAAKIALQERQLGTGDAVRAALPLWSGGGDVLVLFGDTPLVRTETIRRMQSTKGQGATIVVLGFRPKDPAAYGRLVTTRSGDALVLERVVEFADADAEERTIGFCNSGIFLIDGREIASLVGALTNDNKQGEFYLTDIVGIANSKRARVVALEADAEELLGINSRADLATAEAAFQRRARSAAMEAGVTLIDPDTVYFAADTVVGRDTVVGPNVVFGPGVAIGEDVTIEAFCHLTGAAIGRGARIGPFARMRPGARIGEDAHIGNFVEIKNSVIEQGAKANHLAYLGDAKIGEKTNIGAGTITCNYDGFEKFPTVIGAGAFVGTNASLVAPVTIGAGAYIGAGSVVTKDVPSDALAVARSKQEMREGWAASFRERRAREKAKKAKE